MPLSPEVPDKVCKVGMIVPQRRDEHGVLLGLHVVDDIVDYGLFFLIK